MRVAEKIGITRQAYSQLEQREAAGTASIEQLKRAAAALDCDFVYFLLPRGNADATFATLAARNNVETARLQASEHSMVLEGQQSTADVDGKRIGLAKQIYWLRQNLSLYELITVNAGKLTDAGASESLFAHIQRLALEAIVTVLCKAFEQQEGADLNSIDGVIHALADSGYSDAQRGSAERFAERHGIVRACEHPKRYLSDVLSTFISGHSEAFSAMRRFRDNQVVHSEHGFELEALPSFDEFEALYQFAYDFYFLVSDSFLGIGPALMTLHVGTGFTRLLKQLGIAQPSPGFPLNQNVR